MDLDAVLWDTAYKAHQIAESANAEYNRLDLEYMAVLVDVLSVVMDLGEYGKHF